MQGIADAHVRSMHSEGHHTLKERMHDFVMMPARAKWFLFVSAFIVSIVIGGMAFAAQDAHVEVVTEHVGDTVRADSNLIFIFDRPMSRAVDIDISPNMPGNWYFEGKLTRLHLAQDFRFEPIETWLPNTTYTITFKGLRNVFGIGRAPETKQFSFTTQPAPTVSGMAPAEDSPIRPDSFFVVSLDQPNAGLISFDLTTDPARDFTASHNEDLTEWTFTPTEALTQGTRYNAQLFVHNTRIYRDTREISFEDEGTLAYEASWVVRQAPGVTNVSPTGSVVLPPSTISITFDKEPAIESLHAVQIAPDVEGAWEQNGNNLVFTPQAPFAYDTTYTITVPEGFQTKDGGFFEAEAVYSFSTIGAVQVIAHSPGPDAKGVSVDRQVRIDFDQSVDHNSAEDKFSITPDIEGAFAWDGATMIFSPTTNLLLDTGYTVTLASGIESLGGLPSARDYAFTFTTQPSVMRLAVPMDFQDYPLSCEAAALKMALAFKGVVASEDQIMSYVTYDPTPHTGNVWGNPYKAFVGDIRGKQSSTGYGVYWEPIMRAARAWREADYFVNGTVQMLTEEIANGNPVVVWGNIGSGARVDWYTPEGQLIYAFNGEHARVAKGFIGPKDNPTHIIVNDPIYGERTYTTAAFEANWAMLFKAGVIVR